MTTPLSCCIIVKNEVDRIGACIEAVADLAAEVVVVDSGSADGTQTIAERLGARVIFNEWAGYGPQKRFAEQAATNDWILNLDADEIVTAPLRDEIRALMQREPPLKAYRFRIRNVYPGQTQPRLWADNHNYVRLYDRRVVSFRNSAVHDTVDTRDIAVGQLHGSVTHFSARSYEHIKQKLRNYIDLQAKVLRKPAWQMLLRLPFEYPIVFLRYYFLRCHFTGGWDGVYTSHIAAEARVQRLLKMLRGAQ
jgi:glycosyltransferase involved in cell wall biosynthesis